MSDLDRWGSQLAGAAMTLYGIRHFRRGGWILAGFGLLLFRRGYSGHCYTYDLLGVRTGPGLPAEPGSYRSTQSTQSTHGDRASDHVS